VLGQADILLCALYLERRLLDNKCQTLEWILCVCVRARVPACERGRNNYVCVSQHIKQQQLICKFIKLDVSA
jgi:hypothetical protein